MTTIGYGDVTPTTEAGQVFTIFLIITGLGAAGLGGQALVEFLVSPHIRNVRQRRRTARKVKRLDNHYIVCGEGELVDRTINYLGKRAELRLENQRQAIASRVDRRLDQIFGAARRGVRRRLRSGIRQIILRWQYWRHTSSNILDIRLMLLANSKRD